MAGRSARRCKGSRVQYLDRWSMSSLDKVSTTAHTIYAIGLRSTSGERLVLEVEHTFGNDGSAVRYGPTEGLRRGVEVVLYGAAIQVAVGEETLGVF